MPKRITHLSDEQEAAMPEWAAQWIRVGLCTDEADWDSFTDGCRRCYGYAGLSWHGNVVKVGNPLVLSLAAPLAAYLFNPSVRGAAGRGVSSAMRTAVRDPVHDAVYNVVRPPVHDMVHDAVRVPVNAAADSAIGGGVRDAVRIAVHSAVCDAVDDAVTTGVDDAVDAGVAALVRAAVGDSVGVSVRGAVGGAVHTVVHDAVQDAVHGAVRGEVGDLAGVRVLDSVHGAVGGAAHDSVREAVQEASRGLAHDTVLDSVNDVVRDVCFYRFGGQWWVNWSAWTSYFRDVCNLELPGDLWARDRAYTTAQSAVGWWWPHTHFTMVSNRPQEIHRERVGPDGWRSHNLHHPTGPAISWRDGYKLYFWHGVNVPAELIKGEWDVKKILQHPNTEVRRCAIEHRGWDKFITEAELSQVGDSVPDPGNPGQVLTLYSLPPGLQIYEEPARLLLMGNASFDRDGTRRFFGEPVPAYHTDPVAAAAEMFDVSRSEYAAMTRAT